VERGGDLAGVAGARLRRRGSIIRDYLHPKRPLRPGRATVRFETEPDRQLDITNLPNGTDQLESIANPTRRLVEQSHAGHQARVRLRIDKQAGTVTILARGTVALSCIDHSTT
jgi:hypothetical protein